MPSRKQTAAPAGADYGTLYVAIEISGKSWVVGIKGPTSERIGLHSLGSADVEGLRDLIERHRAKAERDLGREVRILCCYEAGYEDPMRPNWRPTLRCRRSRIPHRSQKMPPRNETAAPASTEHGTLYVAIDISRQSWGVVSQII